MNRTAYLVALLAGLSLLAGAGGATAQTAMGTAFTYQGRLTSGGGAVNGICAFQFDLWDAPTGGNRIGTVRNNSVPVVNGLFTVQLDYGFSPFAGESRWLEVRVGCVAGAGATSLLSPRQQLTPAPYALYAPSAGSAGRVASGPAPVTFHAGASDPERMRITASGDVGIGTTTPESQLTIKQVVDLPQLKLEQFSEQDGWKLHAIKNGGHLLFIRDDASGDREWMRITSEGNVGIGTTNPLFGIGNGSLRHGMELRGWLLVRGNGNNNWGDGASRIGVARPGGSELDAWYISANPDNFFAIHQAGIGDRVTVDVNGNVGIGMGGPQRRLHLSGSGFEAGSASIALENSGSGGRRWDIISTDSTFTQGAGKLLFYRPWADQFGGTMVLDSNGNVGIGTTNPQAPLHVVGNLIVTGQICNPVCGAGVGASDRRLKTGIRALSDVLGKLERIHGVSFEWTEEASVLGLAGGQRQIGVIAQDVEFVFPEIVGTTWSGHKAVEYDRLSAVLIEALKELRTEKDAEIAALRAENAALAQRADDIESRLIALEMATGLEGDVGRRTPDGSSNPPTLLLLGGLLVAVLISGRRWIPAAGGGQ